MTYHAERIERIAEPAAGSRFAGWTGACSGTGDCDLTLTADAAVTATFDKLPVPPTDVAKLPTSLYLVGPGDRVRRGKPVSIKAVVTQCPARAGDEVDIYRDGMPFVTTVLDTNCEARMRVRIRRTTTFTAQIEANATRHADDAGPLRIRVRKR